FVVQQPDLGTSLLFLPLFFGMAFAAGAPVKNLALLVVIGLAFALAAWWTPGLIRDYQRQRLISFVHPEVAPHSAASYNARQATLAVAGGGLTGQGWGSGLLNQLERIPERHTDFIFPVMAEEWGFIRTAIIVMFYLLVMFLIARQAWLTPDPYGKVVVTGIFIMFGFQSILHMAISLRLSPITGLTLPLMSYGGSSLISTLTALGLVSSVSIRRHHIFPDRR
ncbi:MAG: FtsW/RodA/SpoVE family cell cycle protein, partial [Planctomycetota bacterium]